MISFVESGQKVIGYFKKSTVYLLAFVLIVSSIYEIYSVYTADMPDDWGFVDEIYSAIIKLIMAEFIIFDPKKSVLRAVGFYAVAIGLSRVITSFSILAQTNTFSLAIGLIFLIMGLNLLYSSYNYFKDTVRGRTGMMYSACILAFVQTITLLMSYQTYKTTGQIDFREIAIAAVYLFQYVVLLLIMDTEELRYSTLIEKTNTRVESTCVTHMVGGRFQLERQDAVVLKHMFDDRSSWMPVTDGGPIELERRLHIIDGRIGSTMMLQKWAGCDDIYVTMVNDDLGSIILANRFKVTEVVPDDDDDNLFSSVRLFDGNRMLAQMAVKELDEEEQEGMSE